MTIEELFNAKRAMEKDLGISEFNASVTHPDAGRDRHYVEFMVAIHTRLVALEDGVSPFGRYF